MTTGSSLWSRFKGLWQPSQASEAEVQETLHQVRSQLPVPVFWLLGKTQSGKSSIVRALTGSTQAEIGNGLRPCTRTAQQYPFPNEEDCLLRFLDTRGLGEVDYDPTEDLQQFQQQAHLVIVVMKALDHAQEPVLRPLEAIHKADPNWPILLVQTCLHEGYEPPTAPHVLPYPFADDQWPDSVPSGLRRSLLAQRELLRSRGIAFQAVAVDFTLPDDGYEPQFYGLDTLWQAIDEQLPFGLRNILESSVELQEDLRDFRYRQAWPQILSYSIAAGAAAGVPVPFVDIPVVIAIQTRMCYALAKIYRQEMNAQRFSEIVTGLGIGVAGRLGTREIFKLIPGLGSAITALYSAAATYALGFTLCAYFDRRQRGLETNKAEFQQLFAEQFQQGQQKLREYLQQLRSHPPEQL